MYGRGFYGPQTGQGPYPQHHVPTALPPPTSSQFLAAWNSVMHGPPAAVPSQINQQIARGPPFVGPPAGMMNTTIPSHESLPQPLPELGRMPITGPYRNSQHNLHYPLHVGTQNSHHFSTPSPLPAPPLGQGHPTYWHPVNSQPKQSISIQGPPIPSTPPPPPLPPPPSSQPPLPYASSSLVPPSLPLCRPLLLASSVPNISSSTLALDVSGQRNDKVVTSEGRAMEPSGKRYGSISALDRSTALEINVHLAPPKPPDEKIMKRIETLCQFIAKNGPSFEDMAQTREYANPEFKFLFGGEPGSDAAVAHEYYQWAKKKYTLGDKLQEGALNLRSSEAGISVQTKPFIMTSVVHPSSDSDVEMEDDITQVDIDQEMERPVEYYRQDSNLVHYDHYGKEQPMPQIVQCAPAQDDEKIMKRIETLSQFIAKNGPSFEDMAQTREYANPEFKFLFGGEPGSDAAVAHEYYQWAKKKYTLGDKLQEGALNLRPSEAGISVQTKPFIMTSVVHPSSGSDVEMEDDITLVDMDQETERPVENYRQDSNLVHYDHYGKEQPMPQIVQCAPAQDVSCDKVPFSEVLGRSDYGHQGSGILPYHEWLLPGSPSNRICSDSNLPEPAGVGIAKKSTTVLADVLCPPISSPAVKSGRPFRLVIDDASDDRLENRAVPHSKEKHTTAELSVARGYINKSDYTECRSVSDLRAANLGKIEQVVRPLSESGKSFVAPTRVSNVKTRIVETVATSSEIGLSDEPSDTNYNDRGTIHNAACLEAFARNNRLRSLSTGSHENGKASDSDSDGSLYAGRRHKKRERSWSRSQSSVGRRNRRRRSLQWAIDRRNRSCSGSSSVVDKKRERKMKPKNRNGSDLGMYDENSFAEKNSLVNLIIALPPPSDSISGLENSTAQPCNASNPLPEKKYSKRKKKQRLKRKQARNNGAEVPYAALQKIKEKRTKRRAQKREATAREKISGKSNLLGGIPNNVLQVADLDESAVKEFSSTCGKQSDIEREEVHGEAHTKQTSFHSDDARISHLSDGKPEKVGEKIQATSAQAHMGIFDFFLSLSWI